MAVVGVLAGVAFLFVLFFTILVCDDQVVNAEVIRDVCRHAQLTDPPVAAVGLVIVALLGVFFSEVSGFGVTLKVRVDQAQRVAEEARQQAQDALLATRYNRIRAEQRAGPQRDEEMRKAWSEMVRDLQDPQEFDVLSHIQHPDDAGMRLAGYAYLYANPDARWIRELADAIFADSKPFNQEMGLRALARILDGRCSHLDSELRARLEDKAKAFTAHRKGRPSRRASEIYQILRQCPPE